MQIVIDVDDEVYERILDIANNGNEIPLGINAHMIRAIVNGTVLPKHGRLDVDCKQAYRDNRGCLGFFNNVNDSTPNIKCLNCIEYAPTILEATGVSE